MTCDVSVVIPAYHSSATLARALASVHRQSMRPLEVIVVDDGSADWQQSREIAAFPLSGLVVHFIHLENNQGVSTTRNVAISVARGRYLSFLDADDVWFRDKLAIQYTLMIRQEFDFSMHRYRCDLQRRETGGWEGAGELYPSPVTWSRFSRWTPLIRNDTTSSVMVLREKMVRYDPSLRRGEDFKCYMELLSQGCRGAYIRRILGGSFKSTIGVSGLSQDVKGMHAGRMISLAKLRAQGSISPLQYRVGLGLETVKYPIRTLLVALRGRAARPHAKPQTASL